MIVFYLKWRKCEYVERINKKEVKIGSYQWFGKRWDGIFSSWSTNIMDMFNLIMFYF